jgi:hypothetical protein
MNRYNKTKKVHGGQCGPNMCQLGGQRIGVLNPRFGGNRRRTQKGRGCGCGSTPPKFPNSLLLKGGACPCQFAPKIPTPLSGGYKATKRNLKYLKMYKDGKSIGFTMRSSLKAKGLIPRSNGTYRVSPKYRK